MELLPPIKPITEDQRRKELVEALWKAKILEKTLMARSYLKDLMVFNQTVLKVEEGAGSVPLAPFHKEMCDFIMQDSKRKLLLIPRGHLKSTLVTVGYSLLRIVQNPDVRILLANATYDMACSFLSQIKKHLQYNETLIDLYGSLAKNAERWSENMITIPKIKPFTKKEATVTAYGMGGNLVSQHYDLIIADDLVNRDFISTQEMIQKTILFYKDALDLLEPTGTFIVIGTRWSDNDLYGWLMDKTNPEQTWKNFSVMVKKAYEGELDKDPVLLFPGKFSADVLQSLKTEKGPVEFSAQYMNEPMPQEDAKFKMDWMKQVLEDELKIRELNYFTMVDPAIGQKKESDKTAIVTIAVDQWNNWFVVNVIWGKFLPNEIIDRVFWNWESYHPRRIGIEFTAYQKSLQYGMIDEMRKRNIFLPMVELKAEHSKAERIEGLIPRYANGTIYHLTQCPYREELEEELMRYPVGKHDDIIDALAYGLQIAHQARQKEVRYTRKSTEHRYLY